MSEIRRKLVIVGDGACGMELNYWAFVALRTLTWDPHKFLCYSQHHIYKLATPHSSLWPHRPLLLPCWPLAPFKPCFLANVITYPTSPYPLGLLGPPVLFASRLAALAYSIRQDLSFDRVLQGNFPRGRSHCPASISTNAGPTVGLVWHSASIIRPGRISFPKKWLSFRLSSGAGVLWNPRTSFVELCMWHAPNTSLALPLGARPATQASTCVDIQVLEFSFVRQFFGGTSLFS